MMLLSQRQQFPAPFFPGYSCGQLDEGGCVMRWRRDRVRRPLYTLGAKADNCQG